MNNIFSYGENIEGYEVRVVNENEVRAAAGILFLFAIISFLNSWLIGNFVYTKVFVVAFMIEFIIRVTINPKYAPTLILGKLITRNQKPFYTGALQKKWAWVIGLILSILMFYLIVLNDIIGPINLFTCLSCLTLLFFEASFGICLGCKVYKLFNKDSLQSCPSGKCEVSELENIQKTNIFQILILGLFFAIVWNINNSFNTSIPNNTVILENKKQSLDKTQSKDCEPPQWAIDIGHAEKWKLHHGCK